MPFLFFCKIICRSVFTPAESTSRMIVDDLLNKFSFRYTEKEKTRFRILLSYFRTALKNTWQPKLEALPDGDPAQVDLLVFDSRYEKKNRDRYLEHLLQKPYLYLSRNVCFAEPTLLQKMKFSFCLTILLSVLMLVSVFRSNKGNLGLLMVELVEASLLAIQLKSFPSIRKVMLFSAYEKDVSFLAYWLMQEQNMPVQVVPSSNPLRNYYRKGVCTTFTFTAAFHQDEFEAIRKDWIYSDVVNWPPFGYEEVLPLLSQFNSPPPRTIGYFSSGNWLREKLGHASWGANEREAERSLLDCLRKFLSDHPDFKLIVFLHPLEKRKPENLKESRMFYKALFGEEITYAPLDTNSVSSFGLVDIGIAVYSSTVFQRLFAGMKTFLAPFSMPLDYFPDVKLESISIRSEEALKEKILDSAGMDADEFISLHQLRAYSYHAFPDLFTKAENLCGK